MLHVNPVVQESVVNMSITITDQAMINIKRLQAEYGDYDSGLRFGYITKLVNSTIDWKESLMESGFEIDNPQAKQPCGCGESINFS